MSHDELDRHLDDQLRAAFAPLPKDQLKGLASAAVAPRGVRSQWLVWLLGAAALCMATFLLARTDFRPSPEASPLGAMWVAAFEDATQRGLANCCDRNCPVRRMGESGVVHACQKRFDASLQVAADARVKLVGTYEGLPTGDCMTLLAQTDEAPVCVFVLPRAEDRDVQLPVEGELHLDRREVGDLVLYSLSKSPTSSPLADFVVR